MSFNGGDVLTSRMFMNRDVVLHTERARRIYKRTYNFVSENLYWLTATSFVCFIKDDRKIAEDAAVSARRMLTDLGDSIRKEIDKIDATIDVTDSAETAGNTDSHKYKTCAKITSPLGARYLQLIVDFDCFLLKLGAGTKQKKNGSNENEKIFYQWQQRFTKFSTQIRKDVDRLRAMNKNFR